MNWCLGMEPVRARGRHPAGVRGRRLRWSFGPTPYARRVLAREFDDVVLLDVHVQERGELAVVRAGRSFRTSRNAAVTGV
jgi:hypothetical protein